MGGAIYASHSSRIVPTRAYIVLLIISPSLQRTLGNIGALYGEETRAKRIREDDNQPPHSCSLYSCLLVLISAPAGQSPGQPSCSLRAPFPC